MHSAVRLVRTTLVVAAFVLLARPAQGATIEIWQGVSPVTNIGQADALIAAGPANIIADYIGLIDFDDLGDGTRGASALNIPWPGGVNTNFAVRLTGGLNLAAAQLWEFSINHDDGIRLLVNGVQLFEHATTTDNIFNSGTVMLNAGMNILEIIFFENGGGASLELYGNVEAECCGVEDLMSLQTVPEPATMLLVASGLGAVVARRRQKTRA